MSVDQSEDVILVAERLRLVLPQLAQHGLAVTPINYAVFFEYVAQSNSALCGELDELTADGGQVDDADCRRLHEQYLAPFSHQRLGDIRKALHAVILEMAGSLGKADSGMADYSESLCQFSHTLGKHAKVSELRETVDALVTETQAMREMSQRLQNDLEENRRETVRLREELELVREEARRDPLTGLANRVTLFDAMDTLIESSGSENGQFCLLMLDIDFFKRINDTHGHLIGDRVICFIADAMRDAVKGKDTVVRYGGEEFVVLLPDTPYAGAMHVAENLRGTIENGRLVRSRSRESLGTVTISIGVACYREHDRRDDLIGRADKALYRAKNSGRNRVIGERDPALGL